MTSLLIKNGTPNIILLVIDCGRPDRFSSYGHYRPTTPNIDALAESGIVYENAYTVDTASPLSHFALMSGQSDWNGRAWLASASMMEKIHFLWRRVLRRLGITDYVGGYDHDRHSLLSALKRKGYFTIGLSANQLVSPKTMRAYQGFDSFPEDELFQGLENDPIIEKRLKKYAISNTKANRQAVYLRAERVIVKAQEHIEKENEDFKNPFFLFMNLMDCHDPYLVHPDFKEDFGFKANSIFNGDLRNRESVKMERNNPSSELNHWTQTKDLDPQTVDLLRWNYDRSLGYLDSQIGKMVAWLKKKDQFEDTMFFILSDHGEQLGEDGFFTHSQEATKFQLHIPLIVSSAKYIERPKRIKERVSIVDIRASIFDLLGERDSFMHRSGESLFQVEKRENPGYDFIDRLSVAKRSQQLMGQGRDQVSEKELELMEERLRDLGYMD